MNITEKVLSKKGQQIKQEVAQIAEIEKKYLSF